ncbi:MAG: PAS domain S-box protein [Limnothrix sp. CACIAM 69d]|nr:MAG: PAS domain S-box protein [Limnothrix sp. CACIAM 69d]
MKLVQPIQSIPKRFRQLRLRWLVVPLVLQVAGAVGLTGWLSLRNGQRAVNDLAARLSGEIAAKVEQHVQGYLGTSELFLRIDAASVATGNLNLNDFAALQRYFWHQVHITPEVSTLYYGNAEGNFLQVERGNPSTVSVRTTATAPNWRIYTLNKQGQRDRFVSARPYDPRKRPWYRAAVARGGLAWSPIYVFTEPPVLGITPALPIYTSNSSTVTTSGTPLTTETLKGVLAIDLPLEQLSTFLRGLKVGRTGEMFIVERLTGALVATSSEEPLFLRDAQNQPQRLKPEESRDPRIRAAGEFLRERFGTYRQVSKRYQGIVRPKGSDRVFIDVLPLENDYGLDWVTVTVVPERDFTSQIQENTRITALLCLGALGLAVLMAIATTRWIVDPVSRISRAAEAIAEGNLNQTAAASPILEVDRLAESFNRMAFQLRQAFAAWEEANQNLELKVQQRTAALTLSEAKLQEKERYLRLILDSIPQHVFWKDTDLVFQGCNKNWAEAAGLENPEAVIGLTDFDLVRDPEAAEAFREQDRRVIESDRPVWHAIAPKQKPGATGETIWLDISKIPIHDNQRRVIGLLGVVEDITLRKQAEEALRREQEKSERLLLNILPRTVADRLKQNVQPDGSTESEPIAQHFEEVSILFADIVGFTPLSSQLPPIDLVTWLNRIFSQFDHLAERHRLEKIKTLGDAYMVAAGLPLPMEDPTAAMANMALDMQRVIQSFQEEFQQTLGRSLEIRVGMNTGPVIAGVIGIRKFIYDLWGDTVNIASRMESQGLASRIQVTEAVYQALRDRYEFESRGEIDVKGRGPMRTYWLTGRKTTAALDVVAAVIDSGPEL